MGRALELAECGAGHVSPNPMVGAVIVKDGDIVGEGYHQKYGQAHAEPNALAMAGDRAKGATMYVSLEPCSHHGKTPPCADAIIRAGLKKVFVASLDPNPKVGGRGISRLREAGIDVEVGLLESEALEVNEVFFHYIQNQIPFVVMKYAMTMDGKIATATGDSKWVSGQESRNNVHRDRHRYRGIMVGSETVLGDDPLLTARIEGGRDPIRIICDTRLRTPVESKVVQTAGEVETIIATGPKVHPKEEVFKDYGVKILHLPLREGHLDLVALMKTLGEMEIDSILLEGGGNLNFSALKSGIVHKIQAYIAPKIIGGDQAKSPVSGQGFQRMSEAIQLKDPKIRTFGEDIYIESKVK